MLHSALGLANITTKQDGMGTLRPQVRVFECSVGVLNDDGDDGDDGVCEVEDDT